jgi:hypothetical protein
VNEDAEKMLRLRELLLGSGVTVSPPRLPSDEEIVAFVRGRYSKKMAQAVKDALDDERSPRFADHVRRSFIREMEDLEQ